MFGKKQLMKKFLIILLAFAPIFIYGRSLEEIKQSGVIYAAFTESSLNSINYKIAEEFAKFLNVELVPIITSWDENFMQNGIRPTDLETNPDYMYTPDALKKADFICGTIYVYEWRKKIYDYAGIMQVSDLLVVKKTNKEWNYLITQVIPEEYLDLVINKDIRTFEDLKNQSISLLQNSSYVQNISIINDQLNNGINIVQTTSEEESQKLLLANKVDGFVSVAFLALKFINEHPEYAKLAFPVGKPFDVGWAVENNNNELANEINNFFETIEGDGTLNKLFQSSYGIDHKTYLGIINSYSGNSDFSSRSYDDILSSGKLVIALREREMIYKANGTKQFSHFLAEELAKFLNLELELKYVSSVSDYFTADDGIIYKDSSYTPQFFDDIDVACDLFASVPWRMSKVDVIGYMPYALVVVGNKDLKITTIADLKKYKGVTAKGTSYENALLSNNITNYSYASANNLLEIVDNGDADYTLASFSIYSLPEYSNLEAKFILGEIKKSGWAIKRNQPKLRQKILEFFDYAQRNGTLDNFFKTQTGMPFKASEKFLIALHQTYNVGVFPFVFYGSDNGLPQENITSIFQDNEGYIWFGTFSGAVKFNGRKMEIFNTSNGLISNEVLDIKQDNNSVTYFATLRGISYLDNNKLDSLFVGTPFKNIFIDDYNRKFFYGDAGIVIYTDSSQVILNDLFDFEINSVRSISQVPSTETYLIGTANGLFLFDYTKKSIKKINNLNTHSVFIDADEKIWISANEGVYYTDMYSLKQNNIGETINNKSNIKSTIHDISQTNDGAIWLIGNFEVYQIFSLNLSPIVYNQTIGLSGQKILSFFVDNEENIWFGYYGGVQKLTNKSLRVVYPNKLKYYVNNIVQDDLNHLWFGFNNRLYVLADSLMDLTFQFADNYNSFVVTKNSNNNIIVASSNGLFEINPKNLEVVNSNTFDNNLLYLKNIYIDSKDRIFISSGYNGIVYYFKDFNSEPLYIENTSTTLLQDFIEIDSTLYGANNTGIVRFSDTTFVPHINIPFSTTTFKKIANNIFVGTDNGLYNYVNDTLKSVTIRNLSNHSITAISEANDTNYIWIGTYNGLNYVNIKTWEAEFQVNEQDGLPGNEIAINGLLRNAKGMMWIGTLHGIATYDIKKNSEIKYAPDCRIETIILNGDEINDVDNILKYWQNNFIFELSGLSFKNEQSIVYEYYLRGKNKVFESSSGVPFKAAYQNLPPGKYTFLYRAKGKDGIWSYYRSIEFTILKPFWLRWWFIVSVILVLTGSVFAVIRMREKQLKARNEELERLVTERTSEIEKQKTAIEAKNAELEQQQEEIIVQKDEIMKQRDVAEKQRDSIAHQQEEIMDSIYYAKRIQAAILPPEQIVVNFLPEHFILYLPRDIVSGDFYWIKQIKDEIVVVAADCTGHGVPGAFMSMLGSALIDEIVLRASEEITAGRMLDDLRSGVVKALHQTGKIEEAKDGMDMALYKLNPQEKSLQFSGAFNPLFIIRGEELIELKADRKPIGIFEVEETPFKTHYFTPEKGDLLYTFSDGYTSQFGGPNGKKFKSSRFKKLFLTIKDKPMVEQKAVLDKVLKNWMGVKYEQIDDIIVIGVKYIWD